MKLSCKSEDSQNRFWFFPALVYIIKKRGVHFCEIYNVKGYVKVANANSD